MMNVEPLAARRAHWPLVHASADWEGTFHTCYPPTAAMIAIGVNLIGGETHSMEDLHGHGCSSSGLGIPSARPLLPPPTCAVHSPQQHVTDTVSTGRDRWRRHYNMRRWHVLGRPASSHRINFRYSRRGVVWFAFPSALETDKVPALEDTKERV